MRESVKAAVVSGVAMAATAQATAVAWQCIGSQDGAAAKRAEAEAWMGEAAERLTIELGHQKAGGGSRPARGWPVLPHPLRSPRGRVWMRTARKGEWCRRPTGPRALGRVTTNSHGMACQPGPPVPRAEDPGYGPFTV